MHVSNLGQREQTFGDPVAWIERLTIDPPGGFGITGHLHVLAEFLVPDSAAFGQECFDLLDNECVSFYRCGVVRLLIPDRGPDAFGLVRGRQSPHALAQLSDRLFQTEVNQPARWAASSESVVLHKI